MSLPTREFSEKQNAQSGCLGMKFLGPRIVILQQSRIGCAALTDLSSNNTLHRHTRSSLASHVYRLVLICGYESV